MYRWGPIVIFVMNLAFANDRPIIRPERQDLLKICGLSQSFKGDATYFVEGRTLPCCGCPEGQVPLEDCLPGEGNMSTTKCGVKPTQTDEITTTTVIDMESTTSAPCILKTPTTPSATNGDPDPQDENESDSVIITVLSIFFVLVSLLAILFLVCWLKDRSKLKEIKRNDKVGSDALLREDSERDNPESIND